MCAAICASSARPGDRMSSRPDRSCGNNTKIDKSISSLTDSTEANSGGTGRRSMTGALTVTGATTGIAMARTRGRAIILRDAHIGVRVPPPAFAGFVARPGQLHLAIRRHFRERRSVDHPPSPPQTERHRSSRTCFALGSSGVRVDSGRARLEAADNVAGTVQSGGRDGQTELRSARHTSRSSATPAPCSPDTPFRSPPRRPWPVRPVALEVAECLTARPPEKPSGRPGSVGTISGGKPALPDSVGR